jgi:ABC-2 type transport system ATP-binding protein
VRENRRVFGRLYGEPNVGVRIDELADEFDLGDILDCVPGQLSAGQKTRVSVAMALINQLEVLLFDEPTRSLDPSEPDGCATAWKFIGDATMPRFYCRRTI